MTALTTCAPLDAEVAAALAAIPSDFPGMSGALSDDSVVASRSAFAAMPVPALTSAVDRRNYEIPGTEGVVVRVHRPVDADGDLPCLFWMHGGGFVLGSCTGDDARFDRWCPTLGLVGVSVEYRLAPETPYPGPLEDCYAGLRWVYDHAADLGVDRTRIGLGGASAGGNLAAALALMTRDHDTVPCSYQLLIYPMLDDRQITPSSAWGHSMFSPSATTYAWSAYLGTLRGDPDVPAYAAPARARDLAGLPPTLIAVGAIDAASDENIDYAVRLRHAGVAVDLFVYAGAPHGFDTLASQSAVARRANRDIETWLRDRLATEA